jgi:hypothetical protein
MSQHLSLLFPLSREYNADVKYPHTHPTRAHRTNFILTGAVYIKMKLGANVFSLLKETSTQGHKRQQAAASYSPTEALLSQNVILTQICFFLSALRCPLPPITIGVLIISWVQPSRDLGLLQSRIMNLSKILNAVFKARRLLPVGVLLWALPYASGSDNYQRMV